MTGRSSSRTASAVLPLLLAAGLAGCAHPAAGVRVRPVPVYFPSAEVFPHVVCYGSLQAALPRYEAGSALERFLYGPAPESGAYLRNPQGMALLDGRLLVCDQGVPDIVAIDLATGRHESWTVGERRPRCPVDITVDEQRNVYVADTTLRSVLVYRSDGTFLKQLAPSGEPALTFRPCAVLAHGRTLYVGDLDGHRVQRWDWSGNRWLEPLGSALGEVPLIAPTGLSVASDGTLLIADALQGRVFRLSSQGDWLAPIGQPGRQPGQFVRPKHVCCTSSGLVFVSDAGRQSVLVFDASGEYVLEIHERADAWAGFTLPAGLVAAPPGELGEAGRSMISRGLSESDEYVIVSDSLSDSPLTVFGLMVKEPEERADAD